ncbi:hypothetical protein [Candidatus Uabimicrobium sp. HlEnr_7]|uniref:hypothetical protein n=1 Tax=Candidatus Uabimicrobium helgolandensis TaxID=3095367 RepID=UPI0035591909
MKLICLSILFILTNGFILSQNDNIQKITLKDKIVILENEIAIRNKLIDSLQRDYAILRKMYFNLESRVQELEKNNVTSRGTNDVVNKKISKKQCRIILDITHNINPPHNISKYNVILVSKETDQKIIITNGQEVNSGYYDLYIEQPGFRPINKIINLSSNENTFTIRECLLAKNRQIEFQLDTRHGLVDIHEIINLENFQKIERDDEFMPGKEVNLRVFFKKYQTVSIRVVMPIGKDPYVLPIDLVQLTPLKFTIRKNKTKIDGIDYEYSFSIDDSPLEKHHIKIEKGIGRFYYTIMIPPETKIFKAYIGYLFLQRTMTRFRSGMSIGRPENLSVPKLVEHLDRISESKNVYDASLEVMERLLKGFRNRKMLKQLHNTEKDMLIRYIESWKLSSAQYRVRRQVVVGGINQQR